MHATEAVYGLAASAFDEAACARLGALKRRPPGKRSIVVAAALTALESLVSLDTPLASEIVRAWPGPHTWILPALPGAPAWLRDRRGRIAVRVTAHAQMAALCQLAGPIISTSANPAGRRPARTLLAARRYFGAGVDLYLGGGGLPEPRPTTIRDGLSGALVRA